MLSSVEGFIVCVILSRRILFVCYPQKKDGFFCIILSRRIKLCVILSRRIKLCVILSRRIQVNCKWRYIGLKWSGMQSMEPQCDCRAYPLFPLKLYFPRGYQLVGFREVTEISVLSAQQSSKGGDCSY